MKLITRDTDYAVRALCYIAKKKGVISAPEMVRQLKMPKPFLRKILQVLNKRGVLKSAKGIGGGFKLGVPADKIRLTDLMEIFQGPIDANECFFKKNICPDRASCPLRRKIDIIGKHVRNELGAVTIASLIK